MRVVGSGGQAVLAMFVSLQGCWKSAPEPSTSQQQAPVTPVVALAPAPPVPEIDGDDLDGTRFTLSDHRGKVVLLTFWGHW